MNSRIFIDCVKCSEVSGGNVTLVEVARKHYQKAHMRLSGNAKNYIDAKLAEIEDKYGVIEYISE